MWKILFGELEKDFYFVEEGNQEKILNFVLSLYKDGLKKFEGYEDFKSIQIITPSKKGMCGTKELNKKIQELINPEDSRKKEKSFGGSVFREGDNVMQMKNNYDIEWELAGDVGSGIFNGEMGKIEKINGILETAEISFDRKNCSI